MTWSPIRVKARYVCGTTGALLHKTNPAHRANFVQWVPSWRGANFRAEYMIKTACRFPSRIHRAVLLNTIDRTPPGRKYYESLKPLTLCPHCFTPDEITDALAGV